MGGRSGPIQAALNLEIPEGNIKYFNVKMEGLNGQLPNLDLVNLVVRLCKKHNIDVGLHHRVSVNEPRCEKTGLRCFRPGPTQTGLYSHRRRLQA